MIETKKIDDYLSLGFRLFQCSNSIVEKTAIKFRSFTDAEKADRKFYLKLSGKERLNILLALLAPLQGDGRIDRSIVRKGKLGDEDA